MPPVLSQSRQLFVLVATASVALSACGGDKPKDQAAGGAAAPAQASGVALTGAGATFPNPIYTKWFDTYGKKTGVRINYQSIGSGGGIRQFTEGTVDFGATDGPMSTEQMAAVKGNVLHVPTVLGAVVLTYNLPAIGSDASSSSTARRIADIFLGRITKWNDRQLVGAQPRRQAPRAGHHRGAPLRRSGTTFIFTDYLSKVSPEWKAKVGAATSVNWPIGLGGKGNEGVTQQVKQTEGAIGYVELIYAVSNKLAFADIKNAAGEFVEPNLASVTAAAASAKLRARYRLPGVDHQCARRRRLSHRVVHLAAGQADHAGRRSRPSRSRTSSTG